MLMLLKRLLLLAFVFMLWIGAGSAMANSIPFSSGDDVEFLDAADVLKLDKTRHDTTGFVTTVQIAEGYYIYRHSLKLEDDQGRMVALELPQGVFKHDEFFGDSEIFTGNTLQLQFSSSVSGPLTLHWQGCAEAGICYPPQTISLALPAGQAALPSIEVISAQRISERAGIPVASLQLAIAEDQATAQRLATLGPVMGTVLFFGFGLLLAFTPCMLPMIPIVSAMVVGSQAGPRRAFLLSMAYVLTMAAVYAGLGVAAGRAGANLQATLQSPWLLGAFAGLFLVLASSLFGLFELRLPTALVNQVNSAGQGRSGGNIGGAIVFGLLSALLVGPCMTAPLAGALLYIGQTGSALQGGLALFAMGLGMGLPLLVIAVFGARILPRPGAWMDRVRVMFGYVMLGMAIMMLVRFLPATVILFLWGAWSLALAIGLIAWAQAIAEKQRAVWILRFGAALTGIWAILILIGAASGASSVLQPLVHLHTTPAAYIASSVSYVSAKSVEDVDMRLADAAGRGQWTLIDFYADWCVSCHVIEGNVFGDTSVIQRLSQIQVVRPDVTHNDALDQALLKQWGVMGPPTLILVGPDGAERRDLRMVGEVDVRTFLARLDAAGIP